MRPGREADQSFPSCVEVKNEWSYNPTPSSTFVVCTGIVLPFYFTNKFADVAT
jgi:hypothetical protein